MSLYDTEFFAGRSGTVMASAAVVVPVVKQLVDPRSVLDIGCGQGEWLDAFGLEDSYGVDIAAPEGERFLRSDLQFPLDLHRTFDLVVCLEVGEHLPESAADTLVGTLVRHSSTVLFSAAVLGQAGIGHINCQPHEYWHAKFDARGYSVNDSIRPKLAGRFDVSAWYRNNVFLYLKSG